jgi:hypothetical protein
VLRINGPPGPTHSTGVTLPHRCGGTPQAPQAPPSRLARSAHAWVHLYRVHFLSPGQQLSHTVSRTHPKPSRRRALRARRTAHASGASHALGTSRAPGTSRAAGTSRAPRATGVAMLPAARSFQGARALGSAHAPQAPAPSARRTPQDAACTRRPAPPAPGPGPRRSSAQGALRPAVNAECDRLRDQIPRWVTDRNSQTRESLPAERGCLPTQRRHREVGS